MIPMYCNSWHTRLREFSGVHTCTVRGLSAGGGGGGGTVADEAVSLAAKVWERAPTMAPVYDTPLLLTAPTTDALFGTTVGADEAARFSTGVAAVCERC